MADALEITKTVRIPEGELSWRFSHASRPGGQSVNTADSRVQLSLDVARTSGLGPVHRARALQRLRDRLVDGVLTVTVQEERSQLRNREIARERLAGILAQAIAPPPRPRRPTKPGRAAVERRLAEKKRRGRTKELRRTADDE